MSASSPASKRARSDDKAVPSISPTPDTHSAMSSAPTRNASMVDICNLDAKELVSSITPAAGPVAAYSVEDVGQTKTFEYRRFLTADGGKISYWHDIPLRAPGGGFNAVIEITRNTKAKMEICTTEGGTPIKQDVKKGKLRDYNIPINWNYGAFPQTWEQPDHVWEGLEGHAGDNDPVDVVDLSSIDVACGSVIVVKPIAALAMIDEGEVDWKIVSINMADPLAVEINSLEDCERLLPGQVDAVREWFTWYKATDESGKRMPDKEPNVFGFDGRALDTAGTLGVIQEAHSTWAALMLRQVAPGKLKLA